MKQLTKILVLAIVLMSIGFIGCKKKDLQIKPETANLLNYDSVGFYHNVICKKAMSIIKKKGTVNEQEIYEIVKEIYIDSCDLSTSKIPSYEEVHAQLKIVADTTKTLSEKYKRINSNYSDLELDYLEKINLCLDKQNIKAQLSYYEQKITNDDRLSIENRNKLLLFIDVANHSYNLWKEDNMLRKSKFWYIVAFDAGGAVIGSCFGWPGALIVGSLSSIEAANMDFSQFEKK